MFTIAYPTGNLTAAKVLEGDKTKFLREDVSGYVVTDEAALAEVPRPALVAIYNQFADKPIVKFESRLVAARRTFPLLDRAAKLGMKISERKNIFTSLPEVDIGESVDQSPVPAPDAEPVRKKAKAAKPQGEKKPGVIAAIREHLSLDMDAAQETILADLVSRFPERDPKSMTTTIRIQRSRYKKENK